MHPLIDCDMSVTFDLFLDVVAESTETIVIPRKKTWYVSMSVNEAVKTHRIVRETFI